jgi:hypothetical protein
MKMKMMQGKEGWESRRRRESDGRRDESEDELLPHDAEHWYDEDWVVAAPQSPVVRRRRRWREEEGEGEDDELLLGPGLGSNV